MADKLYCSSFPDSCRACGSVVDYGCDCPNGDPVFPLVAFDDPAAVAARQAKPVRMPGAQERRERMKRTITGIIARHNISAAEAGFIADDLLAAMS